MRVTARPVRTGPALVAGVVAAVLIATSILSFPPKSYAANSLGTPDPATASPVTVGMIIDGYDGDGSGAATEQGAQMAVRYQNQYGDGLDGHRIVIRFCANDNTPTGGVLCATDMEQHNVVAVIEPSSGQGTSEVPTLVGAGIPYIAMTGGSEAELTTPGAFALLGGVPAILGAVALQAKQKGYSKVTLIVENDPTVVQGTQALGDVVFKAAGVGFDLLTGDPDATNLKPELRQAVSDGASAVGVGGDGGFCSAFLNGYRALHMHLPRYVIATCLGPGIVFSKSLDAVLQGSLLAGAGTSNAKDDALYAAIVHRYARSVNPNPNVSAEDFAGLLPVLSLAAIMKDAPAGQLVTAASILARTEATKDVAIPLFGGATFTCNGTAIPVLKSVCSSTAAIGTLGRGYKVTHIQTYDPTALY
ncbi:MAG TPA: ABC transporter substrate-binding protein [Acidimicrobiales bacterium]|nr:ABC transporter substrate-binding protein [Acidimicrobiales bacterium]